MRGPDAFPPVTTLSEVEARMGLPSLESLLAERDELVKLVAPLRARHGPFGTYQDIRKIELARVGAVIRARAVESGTKVTEAAIEEGAHSHPDYVAFVTDATNEKGGWIILENRITGIADTIQRANVIGRFLAAEAHL